MERSSRGTRTLGIDYGTVRVGLSMSDPLGSFAQPIDAVINNERLFERLKQIVEQEHVTVIVVGMPLTLKGLEAKKAEEVKRFISNLQEHIKVHVTTWDERFTTHIAQKTMIQMGTKKKERQKRDGRIDSMAAAIMLQGYLDSRKQTDLN